MKHLTKYIETTWPCVTYPLRVDKVTLSKVNLSQHKDSSLALWIHAAHNVRDVAALSVQRTVYT